VNSAGLIRGSLKVKVTGNSSDEYRADTSEDNEHGKSETEKTEFDYTVDA